MEDLASRSYWLGLDEYVANGPLRGDSRADVALIGGGFTSLWAAYLLLNEHPDLDVAILEANAVGYGASGRNGGFVMTLVHRSLARLAERVGDAEARKMYLAAKQAIEHIGKTVEGEAIACDLQPNGLIVVSDGPPQDRLIELEVKTAQRLGLGDDFTFLDRNAAQERIHSERIRCGFREETCSLINPARLARGLKRVVERLGARVYEGTPVLSWEEREDRVRLRTAHGSVSADRALVAGNAYVTAWQPTRDSILPFYSYICLTRPLREAEWGRIGWTGREGVEDKRSALHYFRPTIDGRILWGGRDPTFHPDGPKARYDRDDRVFRRLRESFEWFFPQLRDVPFEHRWGGPIAITGDFLPAVGWFDEARRRVAFAYGYNGHGVAISNVAGHAIADLFADRQSEWTDLPIVGRRAPNLGPRALRDMLVRLTLKAQIRADDQEKEAREPLALRFLSRLGGGGSRRE
jgi:glycine/D-amino acid oxidase-like deaminating enzyme